MAEIMDLASDLVGLPERIEEHLTPPAPAACLAFNPWGTLLAVGCRGSGSVALFDWQTRGVAARLEGGHPATTDVTALLWTADGRSLVSGGADGSLTVWDVAAGRPRRLPGLGARVLHLAWADSQAAAAQGAAQAEAEVLVSLATGPAHLLSLRSGQSSMLPLLAIDGAGATTGKDAASGGQVAVASPDGQLIYAGSRGALLVLRRSDLALLDAAKVVGGPHVTRLELTPCGRRLVVTAADALLRVYLLHRPGDRQLLRAEARAASVRQQQQGQQQQQGGEPEAGPVPPERWEARPLEDAQLAASQPPRHRTSLLYPETQAWLTQQLKFSHPERKAWACSALSPDGEYLASAAEGGGGHAVHLWEAACEARLNAVLEGPGREDCAALCWHPRHAPMQLLVAGGDGQVYIWAKAFVENWSAFAPDFTELRTNDEYHEPEDEFDLNPKQQQQQQQQQGGSAANGGGAVADDGEGQDVDIGGPARPQAAATPGAGPLLHLPLVLAVPQAVPQADSGATKRKAEAAPAEEEDDEQQRMDVG